jgi:hypothetical protein
MLLDKVMFVSHDLISILNKFFQVQANHLISRTTEMFVSNCMQAVHFLVTNCCAATVDEHLQVVGAESFNKFQKYVIHFSLFAPNSDTSHPRRINNLDKEVSTSGSPNSNIPAYYPYS